MTVSTIFFTYLSKPFAKFVFYLLSFHLKLRINCYQCIDIFINGKTYPFPQLASNEKDRQREEVVFISRNDAQNRNTIAAQPSGPVPYYSIYDDSDVDLLT